MNDLEEYFYNNYNGILVHKWLHYFDIYDRHFQKFRGRKINILEIGVYHGGSIDMWLDYFGAEAVYHGIDINPTCKNLERDNVKIYIGSQEDFSFLNKLKETLPKFDIIIDDGGHTMAQQINTFKALYDHVDENGTFLIEDLHTSYCRDYGGGYKKKKSLIEFSKNYIDKLNAWYSENPKKLKVDEFTKTTHSMHYYNSILVFEKKLISKPEHRKIGLPNTKIDESLST